jgi:putative salt-induced outer membrane protein
MMDPIQQLPRRCLGRRFAVLPRLLLPAVIAFAGLARPAPALAQAQPQEVDRWQGTAEFTLTDASGNQDLRVLTTAFMVRHRIPDLLGLELRLQARYGSSEGERVAESYRGSLNLDLLPAGRWSPFVHSTAEHDPFRRLDVRINSGAGARYRLYRAGNRGEAAVSLAMLHSYESLMATTSSPGSQTEFARWSFQLTGRQQFGNGVTVTHSTHYQPVYDELGDYLLNIDTGLKVLLTRRVALSISHEFDRDSTPAAGVQRDDRLFKTGVLFEL